jgi:hypothetical protein
MLSLPWSCANRIQDSLNNKRSSANQSNNESLCFVLLLLVALCIFRSEVACGWSRRWRIGLGLCGSGSLARGERDIRADGDVDLGGCTLSWWGRAPSGAAWWPLGRAELLTVVTPLKRAWRELQRQFWLERGGEIGERREREGWDWKEAARGWPHLWYFQGSPHPESNENICYACALFSTKHY